MRNMALALVASVAALGLFETRSVEADSDTAAARERCSTRLSIALLGKSPTAPVAQSDVDALVRDPAFIERLARYANRRFNPEPGATVEEDASYTFAKDVLERDLPWRDTFAYFENDAWMRRYAGNEPDGYMLVAAYRILQNTTGIELTATTNVAGVDRSATGREAAACRGCHYENWFALDKIARVLRRRTGNGNNTTFAPPSDGAQEILDGKTISNEAELVSELVESTDYRVNACRLAFSFLYGRPENTCEATIFDRCLDAFAKDGKMTSAVAAIAKDPSFCQ